MSGIPGQSRKLVEQRDMRLCVRCGGRGAEWHHRRSRRVRDAHRHCACNGLYMCHTCHAWAHAHPRAAMARGLILPQWTTRPWLMPVRIRGGWWVLRCTGVGVPLHDHEVWEDADQPEVVLSDVAVLRLQIDITSTHW